MSLKAFHIFFIIASGLLAVGLSYWGFSDYHASGNNLVIGLAGLLILLLLIPYFFWFRRKMLEMKKMVFALVMLLGSCAINLYTHPLWACAVCYGDPSSPLTKGARYGVFFLMAIVGGVLTAIASVGFSWARRARGLSH